MTFFNCLGVVFTIVRLERQLSNSRAMGLDETSSQNQILFSEISDIPEGIPFPTVTH
jgi:hypothetical protein